MTDHFDDNHHPVQTVEFDFDAVGRALGELENEVETLSKVLVAAEILRRNYDLVHEGINEVRRDARNNLIRIRTMVLAVFQGIHPDKGMSISAIARKHGLDESTSRREARRLRAKFAMPARLLSNQGARK